MLTKLKGSFEDIKADMLVSNEKTNLPLINGKLTN